MKSGKNIIKPAVIVLIIVFLVFVTLYSPPPIRVMPKNNIISPTPIFMFSENSITPYPFTFIVFTKFVDTDTGADISTVGGSIAGDAYYGNLLIPEKPLKVGQNAKLTIKVCRYFLKEVDFCLQEFHYYFTVADIEPAAEEKQVIKKLIERGWLDIGGLPVLH